METDALYNPRNLCVLGWGVGKKTHIQFVLWHPPHKLSVGILPPPPPHFTIHCDPPRYFISQCVDEMTHYFTVLQGSAPRTHCLDSFTTISLGFIFVHCRYRSGVNNHHHLMSHNEQSTDVGMIPVVPNFDQSLHPVSIAETLHSSFF